VATPDRPDDANEAARKEGRVLVEDTLADIAALIVRGSPGSTISSTTALTPT
jgi:hypothetical protein